MLCKELLSMHRQATGRLYGIILPMNSITKRLIFYPLFFLGFLFLLFTFMTNMLYFPIRDVKPTSYKHEDIFIPVEKNQKINAWYIKAKDGFPTIIFSHGNGGNIGVFFPMLMSAVNSGFGVLIYDYRGYGKSDGRPFETGLYKDLESAVGYLNTVENIKNEDIILWGLSIGGAVTVETARKNNFRGVILQSTFASVRDVATDKIKQIFFFNTDNKTFDKVLRKIVCILPVIQRYETKKKIGNIKSPLLILHSKEDEYFSHHHAEINHARNPNSELFISDEGSHNDYWWSDNRVLEFLNKLK